MINKKKTKNLKKFTVELETTGTHQQFKFTVYSYNSEIAKFMASKQFPEYNILNCYEESIKENKV